MRTAVIYFSRTTNSPIVAVAKSLAKGIQSNGHQVELIDALRDNDKKLTIYQYIAVGAEQVSFFGKISEQIPPFLANHGIVNGKKAFAFVLQKTFGAQKALLSLMKLMENEGMFLKNSHILKNPEVALEVGKRLHVAD